MITNERLSEIVLKEIEEKRSRCKREEIRFRLRNITLSKAA